MTYFERTQTDFIKNSVRDLLENPRIGQVVKVYEHLVDDDNNNFEVNVSTRGNEEPEFKRVPVLKPTANSIAIPKVGDNVLVQFLDGDARVPVVTRVVNTGGDRAVKGQAGMNREKWEGPSGDIYLTSYTKYDNNPAFNEKDGLSPEEAYVRIAKKNNALDNPSDIPLYTELLDSSSESRFRVKANEVAGDGNLSMTTDVDQSAGVTTIETANNNEIETTKVEQDVSNGTILVEGVNSGDSFQLEIDVRNKTAKFSGKGDSEMGFTMDFDGNSFKLLDGKGYGIVSDGSGNFTWHHESVDFSEGTTTSL